MFRRILIVLPFALLLLVVLVRAQSNPARVDAMRSSNEDKSKKKGDADLRVVRDRALAQSLLLSLASDAQTFLDHTVRARTEARIADVLWEFDAEQGRGLFRKAWDAAEVADKENQERGRSSGSYISPTSSREEVLRLTAKRDRLLGEEFLGRLKEKQEDGKDSQKRLNFGPFKMPDETARLRLNLARQLLDNGDVERAIQFADSALSSVNIETVDFLSALQERNRAAADQRYGVLLMSAQADPQSDTDTVSILSSYIFTPHLYVTSQGRAALTSRSTGILPANVQPQLIVAFFRVATQILFLRMSRAGQDENMSGAVGTYPVTNHLTLLFEQYGPKEVAEALRAQLERLTALVPDGLRQRDDDWRTKWLRSESKTEDPEKSLLDQIDHAQTSSQRDQLYLELALVTAEKGDTRAREFAEKIEDSELRKTSRSYIDADLAIRAIEKKDAERAVDLARTGELSHIQRVWVMTQASKLLSQTDKGKSLAVLDGALAEARRIDGSDPDRPQAILAVANGFLATDRGRGWDTAFDAVKAANSADGFTGEDGQLVITISSKGRSARRNISAPDFEISGLFSKLAKDDYDRAVQLANAFRGEEPRASAVIVIAHSLLDSKESPSKAETRAKKDSR